MICVIIARPRAHGNAKSTVQFDDTAYFCLAEILY